ncbi:serine/threonine protein kinase [Neorhizobium alkalisoli]|uniref:Serine/threonine protein kinase n=1 Tax=Neorhizobium alkalisoli TaxID=528178 RepID=A0A561QS48_9HYPH|nr:serine/threonine protein kinase [Neorhizobium alkalisoli]
MIFQPGQIINNLKIERYTGSGAFGEVYEATDLVMNRHCAVKFVPNQNPNQFDAHKEGQFLHLCRHSRVVEVYDVHPLSYAGQAYAAIEMEFFPEGSAEAYLERSYVTARQAIRWCIDILFSLEHSHANGVLHRDIKPGNIMISNGTAKLSDFGLATVVPQGGIGSGAGTPLYAAPELHLNNETTIATDIYSVGMTLFELINNIRVWRDSLLISTVIFNGSLIKKLGYHEIIPKKIQRICNIACNKNASKRYASARLMRKSLEAIKIDLNWELVGNDKWKSIKGSKRHQIEIEERKSKFETVYKVNERRDNSLCFVFSNKNDARKKLYEIINQTLVK